MVSCMQYPTRDTEVSQRQYLYKRMLMNWAFLAQPIILDGLNECGECDKKRTEEEYNNSSWIIDQKEVERKKNEPREKCRGEGVAGEYIQFLCAGHTPYWLVEWSRRKVVAAESPIILWAKSHVPASALHVSAVTTRARRRMKRIGFRLLIFPLNKWANCN